MPRNTVKRGTVKIRPNAGKPKAKKGTKAKESADILAKKIAKEIVAANREEEDRKRAEEEDRKRAEEEDRKRAEEDARKQAEEKARKQAEETAAKEKAEDEARIAQEKEEAKKILEEYVELDHSAKQVAEKLNKKIEEYRLSGEQVEKVFKEVAKIEAEIKKIDVELENAESNFFKRGFNRKKRLEEKRESYQKELEEKQKLQKEVEQKDKELLKEVNDLNKKLKDIAEQMDKDKARKNALLMEYGLAEQRTIRSYENDVKDAQAEAEEIQKEIDKIQGEIEEKNDKLDSKWKHFKSYFKIVYGKEERKTHKEVKEKRARIAKLKEEKEKAESTSARAMELKGSIENKHTRHNVSDDDEDFKKAKEKTEGDAKKKEQDFLFELKSKGYNGQGNSIPVSVLSKTETGRKMLDKYVKDAEEIIKVMKFIIKNNPDGFPYPGVSFQLKHKKKFKLDEGEKLRWVLQNGNLFKSATLEYSYVVKQLENIFGDNGYIDRLANSPYTNRLPGRPGFINLAHEAKEAWNALRLKEQVLVLKKVSDLCSKNDSSETQKGNVDFSVIKGKGEELGEYAINTLDECEKILSRGAKVRKSEKEIVKESLAAIKEIREEINEKLGEFKIEYGNNADTHVGNFLGNCDVLFSTIEALICVIPKVGTGISMTMQKGRLALEKVAALFDLKEANSPAMRNIQRQLTDKFNELNKKYREVIKKFNDISKRLLSSKFTERGARKGVISDKIRKQYYEYMNDWKALKDDLFAFNGKCIELGKSYKQRPLIRLDKGKRLTQQAKWQIAIFLQNGVFDSDTNDFDELFL